MFIDHLIGQWAYELFMIFEAIVGDLIETSLRTKPFSYHQQSVYKSLVT